MTSWTGRTRGSSPQTARRLAVDFGSVTATAVDAASVPVHARPSPSGPAREPEHAPAQAEPARGDEHRELASLFQPGHMRRRLDQMAETNRRYGHPFALAVFDASGPGARNGDAAGGQETALAIVGAALRDSIRIVDEAFRLEEDAICVLAPNLHTVEAMQMAERLLGQLDELEKAGGLRIVGLGRGGRLPGPRRRRRAAAAQSRRGDVAGARRGTAGGRRRSARSLTDSGNLSITGVNPRERCQNAAQMPGIRTNAAAEVLGVSPNTLRSWERRYGYPVPKRTVGNHRNYELMELQTLRDALADTGNISSAIELARQRQAAPASGGSMIAAFESFDEAAADRAVEESMALRPLERTVEELLLPAIDQLAADPDREAELEFAARWATGWLHGARRLAAAASRPAGILLLDSSRGQDAEEVHAQALDLALRRAGFRVLVLSNELGDERLERALGALDPTAIVLCGPGADTKDAVSLVRKIRELGFVAPLYGFRATGLIGAAVPSAGELPSQVTNMLNTDLRRRAAQAFA